MQYLKTVFLSFLIFTICCKNETSQISNDSVDLMSISEVVDVEDFSKLINPSNQLVDVRTPEEFAEGFISSAKNINYRAGDFEKQILTLDKSKPILVYCKSGGRSAKSATVFKQNGFAKVYDLKGGFTAWAKAQKPIAK